MRKKEKEENWNGRWTKRDVEKNVETKNFFQLTPLLFSMNLFSTSEFLIPLLLYSRVAANKYSERVEKESESISVRKIACGLLFDTKKDIFPLSQLSM